MRWQGTSLIDAPTPATFTGGELEFGAQTLRFISRDPSNIHAVGQQGADFRMRKVGLTVSRYTAECEGRVYAVNRTSGKRREITDASGSIAATTRGRLLRRRRLVRRRRREW